MDVQSIFALCDADDAAGLIAALGNAPVPPVNDGGETPYLYCTYRGKAACTEGLARRGHLTLHEAAAAGDVGRLEACLSGAPWSVQTLSGDGWTALHLAAFLGHDAALRMLLDRGAQARQWGRAMDSNLAIHAAAAGRRVGKPAYANLIAATGDANIAQKSGYTALMIAAANGFADGLDALLDAGADRTIKSPDGKTAADFTRERGHAELAKRLG